MGGHHGEKGGHTMTKLWKWTGVMGISILVAMLCFSSNGRVNAEEYPEGARLIRFNLHKSVNEEVGVKAGLPGCFTYYYEDVKYTNQFAFDKNGEGKESERFGTAYVWAPYTLIHYDAAGGKFVSDPVEKERVKRSTAYIGNRKLTNTRGDGKFIGNQGDVKETGRRYASDYTIYGNSLALTEGVMPKPERKGFRFLGWYVQTSGRKIIEEQTEAYAKRGEYANLNRILNTRFGEHTKIQRCLDREDTSLAEITLYAKWEKEDQKTD